MPRLYKPTVLDQLNLITRRKRTPDGTPDPDETGLPRTEILQLVATITAGVAAGDSSKDSEVQYILSQHDIAKQGIDITRHLLSQLFAEA